MADGFLTWMHQLIFWLDESEYSVSELPIIVL